MIKITFFALLAYGLLATTTAQNRRVRLRPRPAQIIEEDQLQYYEADDRAGDEDVVLVSPAQELSLYGRQAARSDNYIRPAAAKPPRTKESSKAPPVQTIRNYNKVNDDGSFTFGYEAADGSFKEETRGTDCVVRGKYGYVDPDGNKREFTYVSGNPCDPNAAAEEDDDDIKEESNEASNEPANYPQRPARPLHTTSRPTTVFQNTFRQQQIEAEEEEIVVPRQRIPRPPPTPIAITPRPQLPATTFRPQLLQITQRPVSQRPQVVYSSVSPSVIPTTSTPAYATSARPSTVGHIDFAAEFAKFQRDNNQIVSSTPASFKTQSKASEPPSPTGNPVFSTQLVYDPSSGQYNAQLYQTLPQTNGEFTLRHRVQPTVSLPQAPQQPQGFSPSPLYRHRLQHPAPQQQQSRNPQEIYQRHQNEQLYQNSQQLFAQQQQLQHSQLQQDRQAARVALQQTAIQQTQSQPQQQFYYVSPGRNSQNGPIDAFLRGHGVQF
ncbi:uncharacterized protein LOC143915638 [Arctopsyche grandis]|uniref:uncharacterized protein LOC143915638 n=1 Tax=Arctopsyche grandis TaxID=121162 RepID=UPI00406D739C